MTEISVEFGAQMHVHIYQTNTEKKQMPRFKGLKKIIKKRTIPYIKLRVPPDHLSTPNGFKLWMGGGT